MSEEDEPTACVRDSQHRIGALEDSITASLAGRKPWNWAKLPGISVRDTYRGDLEMVVLYSDESDSPWAVLRMRAD